MATRSRAIRAALLDGHDPDRLAAVLAAGDVPALMAACDVLVHNAGARSLTEALAAGLPAVTYAPIPGHGRANAKVLDDAGLVPWASDSDDLGLLLHQAAAPTHPIPGSTRAGSRGRGPACLDAMGEAHPQPLAGDAGCAVTLPSSPLDTPSKGLALITVMNTVRALILSGGR